MMDVGEYIKLILKKKKWTYADLVREVNKIEAKLGDKRTCSQDFNTYINGAAPFRPKMLVKYEVALGLPLGTLINMVSSPLSKESKRELKEIIKKVRGVSLND